MEEHHKENGCGARKGKETKEAKPRGGPRKHLVVAERAKAVKKVSK